MFCEKCGAENPDDAKFCSGCGRKIEKRIIKSKDKDMILALLISFILVGLGIAYAGNKKKGIVLFVVGFVFSVLGIAISICSVIGILIWVYGLYETYKEVKIANGVSNPNLVEDIKGMENPKKIGCCIAILVILLIAISGISGALSPKTSDVDSKTTSYDSDLSKSDVSSSPSSYSGSGSSKHSSSSNGHDVSSHYEGEHGSSDTYGKVYDDGSVESHQTGHTDYGDYRVDSYMDSSGNIHGTVDVGGRTYHVSI